MKGAVCALLAAAIAASCAADDDPDAVPSTSTTSPAAPTTEHSPAPTDTAPATSVSPQHDELLDALAGAHDIDVFDARFIDAVDAPGEPFVALGIRDGGAVAYLCDGQRGIWLTGTAGDDGSLDLRSAEGAARLTGPPIEPTAARNGRVAPIDVTITGTDIADGEHQLRAAGPTDALVRIDEPLAAGGDAVVGGIIVRGHTVRGVVRLASRPAPTASTPPRPGARPPAQLLTVAGSRPAGITSPCDATTQAYDAAIAALQGQRASLEAQVRAVEGQIRLLEAQLAAMPATPANAGVRATAEDLLRGERARRLSLVQAITSLQTQIADLRVRQAQAANGIGC